MERDLDLFCPSISSLYRYGMEAHAAPCVWGKIAPTAAVYASAKVFQPWLLTMDEYACLAEGVDCYNAAPIHIGHNATVSQRVFLCTAGHDITDLHHHQTDAPIVIEDRVWVCAEAVGQGVTVGEGAVCAARAVVIKDVEPWTVVGGNPAKIIKNRMLIDVESGVICSSIAEIHALLNRTEKGGRS